MRTCFFVIIVAGALGACRDDSVAGPFGLRLRERAVGGSVAAAIRRDAEKRPDCPPAPGVNTDWTMRTVARPAGQVSLPPELLAVSGPTSEEVFFAPDMSAGAFILEAPSLASLELPKDSPLPRSAISTCRLRAGSVDGVVSLISRHQRAMPGDSAHLAFLQVASGDRVFRAGAFAATRALRDSLVAALLAFQPNPK